MQAQAMLEALAAKDAKAFARVSSVMVRLDEALAGDMSAQAWIKREALTTSDFPAAFQLINNAVIASKFTKAAPGIWTNISKRVVRDGLKPGKLKYFDVDPSNLPAYSDGFRNLPGGLPSVSELDPYPTIGFSSSDSSIAVRKFGARIPFSWEAFKEDDYGIIESLPDDLVIRAKRTEDLVTFDCIFDNSGWNQTTYPTGSPVYLQANAGLGSAINAPLTLQSLQAALAQAATVYSVVDPTSLRVNTITEWVLVVPRALEALANTIVHATQIQLTGTDGSKFLVPNPVAGQVRVLAVPYIDVLAAGSAYKSTMWGLFPDGGNGADRPTFATTFLRGYDVPELRIKSSAGQSLGGGELSPYEGSFDNDDIQIRIRYFTDAYALDIVGLVISKGTSAA